MPKVTELRNQHIGVEHGKMSTPPAADENGGPTEQQAWTFVFTDRTYGDQIRVSFTKDTRDIVVRELTGGIVLAGGELPRV